MVRKQPQIEHEQSEFSLARREFRRSGGRRKGSTLRCFRSYRHRLDHRH
jgi:hypothetical protein